MTPNTISPVSRRASGDSGALIILLLMMALVFLPVIGLHTALTLFGSEPAVASAPAEERSDLVHRTGPAVPSPRGGA